MVRMTLRKALANARKRMGLSLRELEDITNISNTLISQYETGHVEEPSFRNVVRLSAALDLNIQYLADLD